MTSHVDPDQIPYVNVVDGAPAVNVDLIKDSARTMTAIAGSVRSGGQDTVTAWAAVDACYAGPGDQAVWQAMAPVGPATDDLAGDLEAVAAAVSAFADDVAPIIAALGQLKTQAQQLVADIDSFTPYTSHDWGRMLTPGAMAFGAVSELAVAAGTAVGAKIESWDQDPGLVDRNNDLIHGINAQVSLYEDAERTCANKINSLYGGTRWHAWGATDGLPDPDSSYGGDEAMLDQMDNPWGAPVERSESCEEKTVMLVPNAYQALTTAAGGLVASVVTLAAGALGVSWERGAVEPGEHGFSVGGYKVTWSWQRAAQTWEGLLDTGLGVFMAGGPLAPVPIPTYDFTTGQWGSTSGAEIVGGMFKSLTAWDEWGRDPGTALGEVVFNVGSFFIPGGGAADAAKVGDVAADASKAEDAAADAVGGLDAVEVADATRAVEGADSLAADVEGAVEGVSDAAKTRVPDFGIRLGGDRPGLAAGEHPADVSAGEHPEPVDHGQPADRAPAAGDFADHGMSDAAPGHDAGFAGDHTQTAADHTPAADHPGDTAHGQAGHAGDSHSAGSDGGHGAHERTGDTTASDGSGLGPGETHTTMRGYEIHGRTPGDTARLDALAAEPGSPIVKVGDSYHIKATIDVRFDAEGYFAKHGINPESECRPGIAYRVEYTRQLGMQEDGLNSLTVGEWQHNVSQYNLPPTEGGGRVGEGEQAAARAGAGGVPGDGQAVLHGPDQVAGGRPDAYDGLGDSGINSSIGAQWRGNMGDLTREMDAVVEGIPEDLQRFIHMNVRLIP